MKKNKEEYQGFEQGPIRPPSEAGSLLIRITRNCPWNRCRFCPVYKGTTFSLRSVDHVIEDIDRVHRAVVAIRQQAAATGKLFPQDIANLGDPGEKMDRRALNAALQWMSSGMESIFLQDANSLIIKPERLLQILRHLQHCFPWVKRVTSYARSHTLARISDDNLKEMALAGLSRIHVGMESGSDAVLSKISKGVDKKTHIIAGQKVKKAGMELSEYIMPGLGGRELSWEHAVESADALNQINPDFIRLRTLAIPDFIELHDDMIEGRFSKLNEVETAGELRLFLDHLDGIDSHLKSDHILNLFEDLDGKYPEDKSRLLALVDSFLDLDAREQMVYLVGRRMGVFRGVNDLDKKEQRDHVEGVCRRLGVTPANVSAVTDEMMKRFI